MKFFVSTIIVFSLSVSLEGQGLYDLNFDDTIGSSHILLDTANPNNIWQVGAPQKNTLNLARSVPNVIVTDTLNPYPVSDTSVFEIINIADMGYQVGHTVILAGYYYTDCDDTTDYGKIEVTPDNGITWIDILNDTVYSSFYSWFSPRPVLTGNSNGWVYFYVSLASLGPLFNIQCGDTIRYRFTFISDSIQTNRDGLMFDDLHFEDWAEGIDEVNSNSMISVTPVPTSDLIEIHSASPSNSFSLTIVNSIGQTVYSDDAHTGETIDVSKLENGVYVLIYLDGMISASKRFIVEH